MAQRSRHIVETCGMKQRCISPPQRDQVWMGAEDKVLLILYDFSIAHDTSRGGIVGSGHCFNP